MKTVHWPVPVATFAMSLLLAGCDRQPAASADESATQSAASPAPLTTEKMSQQEEEASKTATPTGTGLCAAQEEVLFSCQLENRKIASICGVKNKAGTTVAQYRYGQSGETAELSWPEADSADRLKFASVPYSGGGEAQLQFLRGDTQYVVYSRVIRTNFAAGEPNDPSMEDGIFVRKGDRTIARHSCAGPDIRPIDYEKAKLYAEDVGDDIVEFEY